jgi:hypothetical protein
MMAPVRLDAIYLGYCTRVVEMYPVTGSRTDVQYDATGTREKRRYFGGPVFGGYGAVGGPEGGEPGGLEGGLGG